MTLTFQEAEVPEDFSTPDVDNSAPVETGYNCKFCSAPLTYSGRGRKPSKCSPNNNGSAECYEKNGRGSVPSASRSKGSNEKLAKDAVAVLTSMHDFAAMGAMMMQLMGTASSIAQANETFIPRAEAALANDPNLARKILKMGASGGKAMLLGAYVGFFMSVAPTAVMEFKALRDSK